MHCGRAILILATVKALVGAILWLIAVRSVHMGQLQGLWESEGWYRLPIVPLPPNSSPTVLPQSNPK